MTIRSLFPAWRSVGWLAFFAAILAAWAVMFVSAAMSGVDWLGRPVAPNRMPMEDFGALFPMWAIMMAAMMLPTMVPTLATYDRLIVSADGTRAGWVGVLLGYLAVWIAFAALIAAVQSGLLSLGWIDGLGTGLRWLTVALLLTVGAYQFTRAKEVCHGVCHAPMHYFLGYWRTGFAGGARMGLGLGAFCVGCCWGFMALGFVGGVMSLLWMGAATVFMVLEKLPQIGQRLTKPMGLALIGAGLVLAII